MYAVEVRDHIMIAHSFKGEVFGPARRLHGATYLVDVAFFCETLGKDEIVLDIGLAQEALRAILARLNYRNLDDDPQFAGRETTTEFVSKVIFDRMCEAIRSGAVGPATANLDKLRVTLHESHVARAWYEGSIAQPGATGRESR